MAFSNFGCSSSYSRISASSRLSKGLPSTSLLSIPDRDSTYRGGTTSASVLNQSYRSLATTMDTSKPVNIVCIVKGRGKAVAETGIASMNLKQNTLRMSQFCDDQLYNQLMTKVHMIDPSEVVVAQSLKESSTLTDMFDRLKRLFPQCSIKTVPRRFMNDNKGRELIRVLCSRDSTGVEIALQSKVYALLAVSGLVNYLEETYSMYLAPHTIRMVYSSGENCMLIDHGTAVNLELLRSNAAGNQPNVSLYTILSRTSTLTGALTLRSNLLEPPTECDLIESRYEAIDELLDNVELFTSLQNALTKFPDVERAITLCVQVPRLECRASTENKVKSILCIKTALDLLPCITQMLHDVKSCLLTQISKQLNDAGLERILHLIVSKISSNATITSGLLSMRGQMVFAVKQGLDGKLDAMRSVYNNLIDETEETYQLAVKLAFTTQRGFHVTLKIPKNNQLPDIPSEFLKVSRNRTHFSMTTDKLILLNARIAECMESIYNISNGLITQLLSEVYKDIHCLNAAVDAIGNLDMILAFTSVSKHPDYVRPELGEVLAIKSAQHPVAMATQSETVVPNDVYLSRENNFIIITGANNSGKSFYLRTVGTLQVMAQIGCFVPAAFAMIRVSDQLFSRVGSTNTCYNLESSFTIEMKEMAFVLKHKSPTALILLDEFCQATHANEGVEICFAICEQLLKFTGFTVFATHFKEICQLESMHNNCTNFCMVSHYEQTNDGPTIKFDHKLRKGVTAEARYGLKLASTMNFPEKLIKDAEEIADVMEGVKPLSASVKTGSSSSNTSMLSLQDSSSRAEHQIHAEVSLINRFNGPISCKVEALKQLREKYQEKLLQLTKSYIDQSSSKSSISQLTTEKPISSDYQLSSYNRTTQNVFRVSQPHPSSAYCNSPYEGSASDQSDSNKIVTHFFAPDRLNYLTDDEADEEFDVEQKERLRLFDCPEQQQLDDTIETRLVDYSLSPIDLEGTPTQIPQLHSHIDPHFKAVHCASTRYYKDPTSPDYNLLFSVTDIQSANKSSRTVSEESRDFDNQNARAAARVSFSDTVTEIKDSNSASVALSSKRCTTDEFLRPIAKTSRSKLKVAKKRKIVYSLNQTFISDDVCSPVKRMSPFETIRSDKSLKFDNKMDTKSDSHQSQRKEMDMNLSLLDDLLQHQGQRSSQRTPAIFKSFRMENKPVVAVKEEKMTPTFSHQFNLSQPTKERDNSGSHNQSRFLSSADVAVASASSGKKVMLLSEAARSSFFNEPQASLIKQEKLTLTVHQKCEGWTNDSSQSSTNSPNVEYPNRTHQNLSPVSLTLINSTNKPKRLVVPTLSTPVKLEKTIRLHQTSYQGEVTPRYQSSNSKTKKAGAEDKENRSAVPPTSPLAVQPPKLIIKEREDSDKSCEHGEFIISSSAAVAQELHYEPADRSLTDRNTDLFKTSHSMSSQQQELASLEQATSQTPEESKEVTGECFSEIKVEPK